jgi:hypothetical protein
VLIEWYPTANSKTKIAYDTNWRVLDLGSGHNPHPRADILADKFFLDDAERSGQSITLLSGKSIVIADACAMPFKNKVFDFVICSHIAEHIENIDSFCSELTRIARGGYLETPSKLAEILRHAPNHRWFVSSKRRELVFAPTPEGYPLGWFGKLFFSIYFYRTIQVKGRDVFAFAYGCRKPYHYVFTVLRWGLVKVWVSLKPLTYTRFLWSDDFAWQIKQSPTTSIKNSNAQLS